MMSTDALTVGGALDLEFALMHFAELFLNDSPPSSFIECSEYLTRLSERGITSPYTPRSLERTSRWIQKSARELLTAIDSGDLLDAVYFALQLGVVFLDVKEELLTPDVARGNKSRSGGRKGAKRRWEATKEDREKMYTMCQTFIDNAMKRDPKLPFNKAVRLAVWRFRAMGVKFGTLKKHVKNPRPGK